MEDGTFKFFESNRKIELTESSFLLSTYYLQQPIFTASRYNTSFVICVLVDNLGVF
jgi:hypothetical protein